MHIVLIVFPSFSYWPVNFTIITSGKNWIEQAAEDQLGGVSRLSGMVKTVGLPDLHPGIRPGGSVPFLEAGGDRRGDNGGVWLHRKGSVSSKIGPVVIPGSRGSLTYVYVPRRDTNLLFAEAPEAYKNVEQVIASLVEFGLIQAAATRRPGHPCAHRPRRRLHRGQDPAYEQEAGRQPTLRNPRRPSSGGKSPGKRIGLAGAHPPRTRQPGTGVCWGVV